MRVSIFTILMFLSAISFAQTKSLIVIKLDTSRILKSYMHKDYCKDSYLHKFYYKNIGNTEIIIPYKAIIPISWKFRSREYYRTHNKIKTF